MLCNHGNFVDRQGERVQCQSCINEGAGDDDDYSILKEDQVRIHRKVLHGDRPKLRFLD